MPRRGRRRRSRQEFAQRPEALVYESTQLLAARLRKSVEQIADIDQSDLPPPGKDTRGDGAVAGESELLPEASPIGLRVPVLASLAWPGTSYSS